MFWFFGLKACGILAPPPGIEPVPPALEGEVLTTGPPGKSPALDPFVVAKTVNNKKNHSVNSCEFSFIWGLLRTIAWETASQ